jgi:hypothetical protein
MDKVGMPHMRSKLSSFDILKLRPANKCKHPFFTSCLVYEAIAYNYRIYPEGPNPGFCLPFQPKV